MLKCVCCNFEGPKYNYEVHIKSTKHLKKMETYVPNDEVNNIQDDLKYKLFEMELKHRYELRELELIKHYEILIKDLEFKQNNELKDLEIKYLSQRNEPTKVEPRSVLKEKNLEPKLEKRKKLDPDEYINTIKGKETDIFKDELFNTVEYYDISSIHKHDETLENVLINIFGRNYANEEEHAIYSRGYMIYRYFNNKWNIEFIGVNDKDFLRRLVDRLIISLQEKSDEVGLEINAELTDYKRVYNAILKITELIPPEDFEF